MSGAPPRNLARRLEGEGKTVKLLAVGRKGRDYLRREFADRIAGDVNYVGRKRIEFADARGRRRSASRAMLEAGEFDVCTLVYNRFVSVIAQITTEMQLIPPPLPQGDAPAAGEPRATIRVRAGRGDHPRPPAAAAISRSRSIARCWNPAPASRPRR